MSAMGHLPTFGGSKWTSAPLPKADTKVTADFRALSGSDQTPPLADLDFRFKRTLSHSSHRWLLALSSGADWGHQSKCCVRHLPCQPTGSTFAKLYCGAITTNAWSAELLAGLLKRTCITFSRVQPEDRTSRRTWSLCATAATLPIIQSSQDD